MSDMRQDRVTYFVGVDPGTMDVAVAVLRATWSGGGCVLQWCAGTAGIRISQLSRWCGEYIPVEHLYSSTVESVVETPRGAVFSPARSASLLATAFLAGAAYVELKAAGLHPRCLTATETRGAVIGRVPRKAGAADRATAAWLLAAVTGAPKRTSSHVRDAAVAAAAGAHISL